MIYYITYAHIPTKKAFGYAIARMCSAFGEKEKVILVIPKDARREIQEDIFSFYSLPKNFQVKEIPAISLFHISFLGKTIPFFIRKLSFAVSAFFCLHLENGDICYSRDIWSLFLLRLKTKKVFLEIHYLSKIDALSIKLAQVAKKIIVITHSLKEELVRLGYSEDTILVAPDAVDPFIFKNVNKSRNELRQELELPQDTLIVLYSGNLFGWKGVNTLVDAFEYISNAKLVILGGSDDTLPTFKEYVSKKAYANKVIIVGYKKHEEVPKYLIAANLLALPNSAKEKISKYNTSPLKLFEYMASGVPIVASDLPSMREILSNKNAMFFDADNKDSLAKTLTEALNNIESADIKNRAKQALSDVEKYTWKNRSDSIISFIGYNS